MGPGRQDMRRSEHIYLMRGDFLIFFTKHRDIWIVEYTVHGFRAHSLLKYDMVDKMIVLIRE